MSQHLGQQCLDSNMRSRNSLNAPGLRPREFSVLHEVPVGVQALLAGPHAWNPQRWPQFILVILYFGLARSSLYQFKELQRV
jgi:hypothetical protein